MLGDPIITIPAGLLVLQPGSDFSQNQYGWDMGTRTFLTSPLTPRARMPVNGQADSALVAGGFPLMYVIDVTFRQLESTLIEITVSYKGLTALKPVKLLPGCATQVLTIPMYDSDSGDKTKVICQIPVPALLATYITTVKPDLTGVGAAASEIYLPDTPDYSITGFSDPDQPLTFNLITGWLLQSRDWDDVGGVIWEVKEHYQYFYSLAF